MLPYYLTGSLSEVISTMFNVAYRFVTLHAVMHLA